MDMEYGTPTEDMILPDDFIPQGGTPTPETAPKTEEKTENPKEESTEVKADTTPKTEEARKLKVKFLKEEREFTEEEAKPLIQKGLNYDHEKAARTSLETKVKKMESVMKRYGFDNMDAYVEAMEKEVQKLELNQLLGDVEVPDAVKALLEKTLSENQKMKSAQSVETEKAESKTKKDAEYRDFFEFTEKEGIAMNPDDIAKAPWFKDHLENGIPLVQAYKDFERAELKREMAILKQNKSNETKAPLSGGTQKIPTKQEEEDPFMRGFLNG